MASWPNPLCWLMMTLLWHWWPDVGRLGDSVGFSGLPWIEHATPLPLHNTRRRICSCRGFYHDFLLDGFPIESQMSLKLRTPSFQRVCAFFVSMIAVTLGRYVTSTLSCTLMIFIPSLQQKMMKKQRMLEREACSAVQCAGQFAPWVWSKENRRGKNLERKTKTAWLVGSCWWFYMVLRWFYVISAYFNIFKAFFEMIIDNRAAWAATVHFFIQLDFQAIQLGALRLEHITDMLLQCIRYFFFFNYIYIIYLLCITTSYFIDCIFNKIFTYSVIFSLELALPVSHFQDVHGRLHKQFVPCPNGVDSRSSVFWTLSSAARPLPRGWPGNSTWLFNIMALIHL